MVLANDLQVKLLSQVCEACNEIFLQSHDVVPSLFFPDEEDGYRLRHTKATFERALADGCRLCSLVWYRRLRMQNDKTVPWDDWDDLASSDDIDLRYGFTSGTSGYRHMMGFWRGMDLKEPNTRRSFFLPLEEISSSFHKKCLILRDMKLIVFFNADELAQSLQKEEEFLTPESTSSSSLKSLTVTKGWLENCLANHSCSLQQQPGWTPTRLIDVGSTLESKPPRVVLASSLEGSIQWVTLSHCWGDVARQCKLLVGNLGQYLEKLPLSEFSKTFLDALSITRTLGFRYLWIDSVCIIQDDLTDWGREAASMHQVYSLSTCTISASHAADGQGGCYSQRNPRFIFPCVIPLPFTSEGGEAYCKVHAVSLDDRWKSNVEEGPLFKRAWVFQERLLSPRTLYFGQEQILWGCAELEACESLVNGQPIQPSSVWWQFSGDRRTFANLLNKNRNETLRPLDMSWPALIREYSATKISFAKDRLLAFTGLMEALNVDRAPPHSYGVWLDETIAWNLLWTRSADPPKSRPVEFIAPSWSWLSLHMPVRYSHWLAGRSMVKELAFMETSQCSSTSATVLRQRDALILRAVLKVAWCREGEPYSDEARCFEMGHTVDREEESVGLPESASLAATYELKYETQDKDQVGYPHTFILDVQSDGLKGNVIICMPTVNYEDRVLRFEGLVLEPLEENPQLTRAVPSNSASGLAADVKQLPTFRRIGHYGTMHGTNWVATTHEMDIALV